MEQSLVVYAAKKGIKLVYLCLILALSSYLVNLSIYNYFQYKAALMSLERKAAQ